jgi:hypothetical protein
MMKDIDQRLKDTQQRLKNNVKYEDDEMDCRQYIVADKSEMVEEE